MGTVVVTGGATGIGFAIARRLSGDGDGVVLASRNAGRLAAARDQLRAEGGRCEMVQLDVRDAVAVARLFEASTTSMRWSTTPPATSPPRRSISARTASAR